MLVSLFVAEILSIQMMAPNDLVRPPLHQPDPPVPGLRSHRIGRGLFGLYLVFIVYGSLFPFNLTADRTLQDLAAVVRLPYEADGRRVFSLPDLVSNVLLGLPFGPLAVVGGLVRPSPGRVIQVGALSMLLSISIEASQFFVPGRTASLLDVAGQLIGALGGCALWRGIRQPMAPRLFLWIRARPASIPIGILVVVLAAEALYPYRPTLDVSTVRANLREASWIPFHVPLRRPWYIMLAETALPYAALSYLLRSAWTVARASVGAWGLATATSLGLELLKPFIEGRSPTTDNVLAEAIGALAGIITFSLLRELYRTGRTTWALVLVAVILA